VVPCVLLFLQNAKPQIITCYLSIMFAKKLILQRSIIHRYIRPRYEDQVPSDKILGLFSNSSLNFSIVKFNLEKRRWKEFLTGVVPAVYLTHLNFGFLEQFMSFAWHQLTSGVKFSNAKLQICI